jgi:hypothetical protein
MMKFEPARPVGNNLGKIAVLGLTALLMLWVYTTEANACMGDKVLLQDNFNTMDPNWRFGNQNWAGNGIFLMTPQPGTQHTAIYDGRVFGDMDACVDVVLPAGDLSPVAPYMIHDSAGLVFWATKFPDDYEFLVSPLGMFAVIRSSFNPTTITNWTRSPAIKPGLNQVNALRVVTKGSEATFYVNGTRLGSITGQPPGQGSKIGLVGASGPDVQSFWHFSNLKVTD